jgi:hypothetical protein
MAAPLRDVSTYIPSANRSEHKNNTSDFPTGRGIHGTNYFVRAGLASLVDRVTSSSKFSNGIRMIFLL